MVEVSFLHLYHYPSQVTLERLFRKKIEGIAKRHFENRPYQLLARFNSEESNCRLEVELHVFSQKIHLIIKKTAETFGEAVAQVAEALKERLEREKTCRLRQKKLVHSH